MGDDLFEYDGPKVAPVSRTRRMAAREHVERALEAASPLAIRFQVGIVERAEGSDDLGLLRLGMQASESILDRVMGKAAQTVNVTETEARPIMFDAKLRALTEGLEAARKGGLEAFERAVTAGMVDGEGVSI